MRQTHETARRDARTHHGIQRLDATIRDRRISALHIQKLKALENFAPVYDSIGVAACHTAMRSDILRQWLETRRCFDKH